MNYYSLSSVEYQYLCNLSFQVYTVVFACSAVQPMWRNFVAPANWCSRQSCASSLACWCSRPRTLTCQSAMPMSFSRQPTRSVVQSLLRSNILSTTASYELARCWKHDCCSEPQSVMSKTSQASSSSFCCIKARTVGHQNQSHICLHQLRHYIPRQLVSSTKTIVDASPLSLQPYLRLIRFDRPIGITTLIC